MPTPFYIEFKRVLECPTYIVNTVVDTNNINYRMSSKKRGYARLVDTADRITILLNFRHAELN